MAAAVNRSRYTTVAITLHWVIAAAILVQIGLGLWMTQAIKQPGQQTQAFEAFQLHKSIGLTVLVLSLVRLGWRLTHLAPPLPKGMKLWEKRLAQGVHWLFYGLMLALPLSGWLYVSTGWSHAFQRFFSAKTIWFDLLEIPHLPFIAELGEAARRTLGEAAIETHEALAFATLGLLALHVGAALKHTFLEGEDVLYRMAPFGRRGPRPAEGETR